MLDAATYIVADLKLPVCPWCKRPADKYYLLVYHRDNTLELEVMCERCQAAAIQFAHMHQAGISRHNILIDFGFRGRDAPWPARPSTGGLESGPRPPELGG
jgi:hypothetical protein